MADRYWVGTSAVNRAGTWTTSSTTVWSTSSGGASGASVPTTNDNVIFDQAATYTVTLTGALVCSSFTVSANTITFSGAGTPTISGSSMTLLAGTVWSGTGLITFTSASLSTTITTNGTTFPGSITFNNAAATFTLGSALTLSGVAATTVTLTSGTISLNGFNLTCPVFLSDNTNVRSLAFGTNNIVLSSTTVNTVVLSMNTATNFTWTGSGGFVGVAMPSTLTFNFGTVGGTVANAVNLTLLSGSGPPVFATNSWFKNLDLGTNSGAIAAKIFNIAGNLTLGSASTYNQMTINMLGTGNINCNGKSMGPLTINNGAGTTTLTAAALSTTFTMTAGTINFASFNLTCSAAVTYTLGTLNNIGTISCTTWNITALSTFTLTSGTISCSTSFILPSGAFNFNGGTLTTPLFTHTLGTVTLGASMNIGPVSTYTLTGGTLALAGFTLTCGIFSSSNSNVRTVTFGSGNIVLAHTTANQTVLQLPTATNFTWTGTGGFTSDASVTRTFQVGTIGASGNAANAPNLTFTTGGSAITIDTNSWFNNLDFGSTTSTISAALVANIVGNLTLTSGGTFLLMTPQMVGTGTITTFSQTVAALTINASGTTTLVGNLTTAVTGITTLTLGTLDISGYTLTTGTFVSNNTNVRSLAFGSGTIALITTTAAAIVLSMNTATNFTSTGTGGFSAIMSVTRTFQFGASGGTAANAVNLTLTSGSSIATLTTSSWFNKLNFGTTAFTVAATTLNLQSITLSSTGTFTNLTATMVGSGSLIGNGKTIAAMDINGTGITTTLAAAFGMTGQLNLTEGTLALAGFTLTIASLNSGGTATRAISGAGTGIISCAGNWQLGSPSASTFSGSDYYIYFTNASGKTMWGNGGSFGIVVQASATGELNIRDSNTIADIQATARPSRISFQAGQTTTVTAFTLSGTAGNLVTILSDIAATQFSLSKASGTVTANYLSIKDSNATGGATWYAGNGTNLDAGNNTGWGFTPTGGGAGGKFFAFF